MSAHVRHPLLGLILIGCILVPSCARRASDGDGSSGDATPPGDEATELEIRLPSDSGPVLAPADNAPAPDVTPAADEQAATSKSVEPIEVVLGDARVLSGISGDGPLTKRKSRPGWTIQRTMPRSRSPCPWDWQPPLPTSAAWNQTR